MIFSGYQTNRLYHGYEFSALFFLLTAHRENAVLRHNSRRLEKRNETSARILVLVNSQTELVQAAAVSSDTGTGLSWMETESGSRADATKKKSGPGGPSTGQKVFRVGSERVSHWGLSEKDPWTVARIGHADRLPSGLPIGALRYFDDDSSVSIQLSI